MREFEAKFEEWWEVVEEYFTKETLQIHSHIKFIVIVYSQNLQFRKRCKKLQKQ
jgi:hypothetical protein